MPKISKTHQPMSRSEFDDWKASVLQDAKIAETLFDPKAFIADVKRFNPKAAEHLQVIFDEQEKLYTALKGLLTGGNVTEPKYRPTLNTFQTRTSSSSLNVTSIKKVEEPSPGTCLPETWS